MNVNGLKAAEGITFSEQTQRQTNLPTRCGSEVSTMQLLELFFFVGYLFIEQNSFLLERSLSGSSLSTYGLTLSSSSHLQ